MAELVSCRKRLRGDSPDSDPDSKRIREDLLSLLDESDIASDRDSASHDLDSVIRSFEEEISGSGTPSGSSKPQNIVDLSDSGESLPELGQLLELDLDTLAGEGELLGVCAESSGIGEFWEFEDELQSYDDSFGFGMSYMDNSSNSGQEYINDEYVAFDGIFDCPDVNYGSDNLWLSETLPAL